MTRTNPLAQCSRALRFLIGAVLLCYAVTAQQIRLANYSQNAYEGWVRRTIDAAPPHDSGMVDGVRYVLGKRIGIAVRHIDVRVRLEPGAYRTINLANAAELPPPAITVPDDPAGYFGIASVAGVPLLLKDIATNGAGLDVHLAARVGRMFHVDLWCTYYPGQAWVPAELAVTCSNPSVPDMGAEIPPDFKLRWGDADVLVPGLPATAPLLNSGEHLADGQARGWPMTIVWRRHLQSATSWGSVGAAWQLSIGAVCLQSIGPLGPSISPPTFDPVTWTNRHFANCLGTLHSWSPATLGVAARSGDTGAQEDQGAQKGNEAMHPRGAGAELPTYLASIGMLKRPNHHLEADGEQVRVLQHPLCTLWDARPHFVQGRCLDALGKPRELDAMNEAHGWNGPDIEHDCRNRLEASVELFGSPMLQWELRNAAKVYLLQARAVPTQPSLSAVITGGARSALYGGKLVVACWRLLEDRALAEMVAERWRQRVLVNYVPNWGGHALGVWDPRRDDRITSEIGAAFPTGWMPYQEAVGNWGMWLASSTVGPPEGVALARSGARCVVEEGFSQVGATWVEWDMLAYTGTHLPPENYVEHNGAHRTGWFSTNWFPLGVAAALATDPGNPKARAIWLQMVGSESDATTPLDWFPAVGVAR